MISPPGDIAGANGFENGCVLTLVDGQFATPWFDGIVSDRPVTIGVMKNYTYRARWSMESGDYVGSCLEFPLEEAHAPIALEAIARITERVAVILEEYERDDADPPPSLTDKYYSGTFLVRTSPTLHARLMADRGPVATTDPFF